MNYPIIIAGIIVFMAFIAHTFVGIREAMSTRPSAYEKTPTIERNWVQSMCAFQMVTIDLFALSILLLILGATEMLPARKEFALYTSLFLVLWGVAWFIQILVLRRSLKDYLMLSQWAFWFACAGLLFWGSQSL